MTPAATHQEPFVHLVDLGHDRVLVAWGAFWFRQDQGSGVWCIVDDEDLPGVAGRHTCIGHAAEPFGPGRVEVIDESGAVMADASTEDRTWVWVEGLQPDTEYRYRVVVDGAEWAAGERWDWLASSRGGYNLAPSGRSYDLRFRTWPDPMSASPALRFAALGDYGVGTRSDSESTRRQRRVAEALEQVVTEHDVRFVVSLGDNIYRGESGAVDDETGAEDDEWYSSYFQPYRYVISRVPVFPTVGNHDASDSESSDDRAQMEDNFHTSERFRNQLHRASVDPGLFYRLRYGASVELVCLDTSQADADDPVDRFFQDTKHREWLEQAFRPDPELRWRIPFSHHPVFCAGPAHKNDDQMIESLVPLFSRGGVRLALAGHEHNFQVSEFEGCTYVVSGSGGKLREGVPKDGFESAHTRLWAEQSHLLLIDIEGDEARITPVSGLLADGQPHVMTAQTPANETVFPPFPVV